MIDIFDRIADEAEYKNTIENARFCYNKMTDANVIAMISQGLDVSLDAAKEIFESEVLNMATA